MPAIKLVDSHFTRSGRLRCASQSRTMGPSSRLCTSQLCNRGDDLAKHPAASSTKGVVGSPGSNTPSTANARAKQPAATRSQRFRADDLPRVSGARTVGSNTVRPAQWVVVKGHAHHVGRHPQCQQPIQQVARAAAGALERK